MKIPIQKTEIEETKTKINFLETDVKLKLAYRKGIGNLSSVVQLEISVNGEPTLICTRLDHVRGHLIEILEAFYKTGQEVAHDGAFMWKSVETWTERFRD